jgi:hypothetical protein
MYKKTTLEAVFCEDWSLTDLYVEARYIQE